jgi:hypothetical protein
MCFRIPKNPSALQGPSRTWAIPLIIHNSADIRRHLWACEISLVPGDTVGSFDWRGCPKTPLLDKGTSSGLIPWCLDVLQDSEESISSSRSLQNLGDTFDFLQFRTYPKIELASQKLSSISDTFSSFKFNQTPKSKEALSGTSRTW